MATRKSNSARGSYVTLSLEDRIHSLEKRATRTEQHRAWERSLIHRACLSLAIYIGSALMLTTLMVPGWYVSALTPVVSYWIYLLFLHLVRAVWYTHKTQRRS